VDKLPAAWVEGLEAARFKELSQDAANYAPEAALYNIKFSNLQ
jgi:hypothetical protein